MKLLLLDSSPEVEQFAAGLDAGGDFETVCVRDLESALARLRASAIDIVIVAMPCAGPSGVIEILRRCQAGGHGILLVMDRLGDIAAFEGSVSLTIDDFVVRPLDLATVQTRLRLIQRRRNWATPPASIVTALPDSMFRLRRDGTFVDFRAPHGGQVQGAGKRFEGSNIAEVMPDRVAGASLAVIREVLDKNAPGYLEYELPLSEGTRTFEARVIPSGADEALFIVRDITERKRQDAQLRTATEVKRAFTSRVISAQEAERQYLSRELHERIGQMLLVHRMDAEWLARRMEPGPLRDAAEELSSSLDRTLETVRNLAMDLRPPAIDDLGIGSALETLAANISRRSGIRCECEIDSQVDSVPADVSVAIYRIAQEALTNAVRHAQCDSIMVYLSQDDRDLELRVEDDGIGFDPSKEEGSSWLGLVGMRERAELVGGRVTIDSGANQGTSVKVVVPIFSRRPATDMLINC